MRTSVNTSAENKTANRSGGCKRTMRTPAEICAGTAAALGDTDGGASLRSAATMLAQRQIAAVTR